MRTGAGGCGRVRRGAADRTEQESVGRRGAAHSERSLGGYRAVRPPIPLSESELKGRCGPGPRGDVGMLHLRAGDCLFRSLSVSGSYY